MRQMWTNDRWEPQTLNEKLCVVGLGAVIVFGSLILIGVFA